MDIAALSIHLNSAKLVQQSSLAMMKKTMDLQKDTTSQLIQMMRQTPSFGHKLDVRA